jgi:serine protease SohB
MLAKLGIERRVYSAGERKAQLDPFRPEDEKDVAHLKALQQDLHAQFIDYVRLRRGAKLKGDDAALFSGDFWSGRQALSLGLVDGIDDLRSRMRAVFGDKVRLRVVAQQRSWLQRRFGLDGRAPHWPRDVIGALDERALWARYGL